MFTYDKYDFEAEMEAEAELEKLDYMTYAERQRYLRNTRNRYKPADKQERTIDVEYTPSQCAYVPDPLRKGHLTYCPF